MPPITIGLGTPGFSDLATALWYIYYVGICPMQSVLFRYVHPARRVTSPLSGRRGHVYNDCISISSTYNILSSSLPESPILPQNQNKWCLAIFWFNELPFKRLKIDHEFSTCRSKMWDRLSTIIFMSKSLRSTVVPPFFMHNIYVYNWCEQ